MLKNIQRLRGFGIFDDYTKPPAIADFAEKNVIYGWNYSGKTTLSRLFAQFESKTANPDLAGCSFSFDTDKGQAIYSRRLGTSRAGIRQYHRNDRH